MARNKEAAYVLPADASTSAEPQHFGGVFPGLHTPGKPTAISEIGDAAFDADAAAAAIKEHGLPLEKAGAAPATSHSEDGDG
jgi:hypothetical protein